MCLNVVTFILTSNDAVPSFSSAFSQPSLRLTVFIFHYNNIHILFRTLQVDASKTSTLEAAAKPVEPPAPKPEEKKPEKKSTFGSMFKPKVNRPR